MKKAIIRIGLIILILSLVSVSVWLAIELNNKRLQLNDMQAQMNLERTAKVSLQKEFFATKNELDKVKIELDNTQKQLNDVNNKLAVTESNNAKLLDEKKALESKLHSLKELKEAIRGVKREMWQERYQQILAEKEIQKEIDTKKLAEGNRGFLLKEGKPTYKPVVRIEVRPGY